MTPELTFLGHQGWAVETEMGAVLIDPLEEAMGNGACRLPVWPERRLNFNKLGTITELVISHEHSDHFDLETIWRLPYRGTVHIPDLSSDAMEAALAQMGFSVRRMRRFEEVELSGGLRLMPLPIVENIFERDVYGMLVHSGEWSFLTLVDGLLAPDSMTWLAANCPCRTIDNYTNNATEMLPHLHGGSSCAAFALGRATLALIEYVEQIRPLKVVISGQGWCFSAPHEQLNRMFFPVASEALARIGQQLYPFIQWTVGLPGQKFAADMSIVTANYIESKSSRERVYDANVEWVGPTMPWTGDVRLSPEALDDLIGFITGEFSDILAVHAEGLLEGVMRARGRDSAIRPVIGLRLLDESGARHFVNAGFGFTPDFSTGNFRMTSAVGIEIWASDLLCLAKGEDEAFLVYESSVRRWNNIEDVYELPVVIELFAGLCPQMRTKTYAAAYASRLEAIATSGA